MIVVFSLTISKPNGIRKKLSISYFGLWLKYFKFAVIFLIAFIIDFCVSDDVYFYILLNIVMIYWHSHMLSVGALPAFDCSVFRFELILYCKI